MASMSRLLLLLFCCFHLLTVVRPDDKEDPHVEVIVDSSPCSVTCGLGMKKQTLCAMKKGDKETAEGERDMRACNSGGCLSK